MKKGQVYEGVVERVDFPNKAVVRAGEETCIVKGGLPGQKISFIVTRQRTGKAEGRLLSVLEASSAERGSPCSHFGICGGCAYLSLPYEEQLKLKEKQVRDLLDGVLSKQAEPYVFEGIRPSPRPYEYRNKMEFSFGDEEKGGPLALGMHKRNSFYDIVTVRDCRLVDEDYRRILEAARAYFAEKGVCFFHRLTHKGYLRHLLVRKAFGTGEILAALVTTSQSPYREESPEPGARVEEETLLHDFTLLLRGLSLKGRLTGILHIINDSPADVVQSDETRLLYGRDFFYENLLGLRFRISAFSFFQTNTPGAEVLYSTAREYVGADGCRDKVVFDLYSGTGTIAQLLAPVAKKVIGVEIVEEAVEAAGENAKLNGLENCAFIAGDVLKVLDEITDRPDFIVLDPPRDGVHPKALPKILAYGVEKILYISCKPTSLARDLAIFLERGYRVERAVAVDQFPFTASVETVVSLSQQKPDDVIRVGLDLDELEVTPAEAKATYGEIKAYVKEHTGLAVSSLYIAQVKQKYGIIERENYNKPKSEDARQPKCPEDKEKAIVDALRHFQMISDGRMEAAQ